MDKNNQESEEIVISERTSMMAYWVVLLTSLSWIGAFMLQRKKTAIVMLLIQIVLVAFYYTSDSGYDPGGYADFGTGLFLILIFIPSWLGVWLWGLKLTGKVAPAHNGLNVIVNGIIIAVYLVSLLIIISAAMQQVFAYQ